MVQVICEKTGIEFEASSKRTKNHPAIMSVVNQANKEMWYNQCLEALAAGRESGLDTVEQFLGLLKETQEAALNQQFLDYKARAEAKRRDRIARQQQYQAYRLGLVECEDDERDSALDAAEATNAQYVVRPHDMTGE